MTHDEANALLETAHQSQVKLELAHLAHIQRRRRAVRAAHNAGIPQNLIAKAMSITPTSVNRIIKGTQ